MPCKIYLVLIDHDMTRTTWVLRTHRLMDIWRVVPYIRPLKFIENGRVLNDVEMMELVTEGRAYKVVLDDVQRNPNDPHLIEDDD